MRWPCFSAKATMASAWVKSLVSGAGREREAYQQRRHSAQDQGFFSTIRPRRAAPRPASVRSRFAIVSASSSPQAQNDSIS